MAACPTNKIDSNDTGLRFAIEKCLKVLPSVSAVPPDASDPIWYPLEPNSYGDMGTTVTTVARNPINPSRQRQKGVVTDLEASASFQMDLTSDNHLRMVQGFCFAHARERPATQPLNGTSVAVTGVTVAEGYLMNDSFAGQVEVGDILFAEGFGVATNNGVKLVTGTDTGEVLAAGLSAEASPPAAAKLRVVGFQCAVGELELTIPVGDYPRLTASTTDLTTLGITPGEWIYVGGDATVTHFTNNQGYARVDEITAGYMVLGKTSWVPVVEAGGAKTIQLYFGTVIKNEEDPDLIVETSFQFERTLGRDEDGTMSQYIEGCIANELTLNVAQADKVTSDMSFVACDGKTRSGSEGLKDGTRPSLVKSDAYNTSSDVRRLAFSIVDEAAPLFVYATDLTITINNNASGAKAIGTIGNFAINIGMFDVGGSVTAYFQDVRAINSVRDNADVTMDLILAKNNTGMAWDVPLLALGNGMLAVEQDQAITVPLDTMAAQSKFGHTLLYVHFPYLPNAA
jgi:hypothetical protein